MQVSSQWVWSSHCFLSSDPVSIKTWMHWARIAFCRMERYSRSLWARAGELICPWNRTVKENYWPEQKANEYSWSSLTCNEMKAFARPIIAHQALRELLICSSKDTGFGIAGAVGVTPWLSLWWSAVLCLLHRPVGELNGGVAGTTISACFRSSLVVGTGLCSSSRDDMLLLVSCCHGLKQVYSLLFGFSCHNSLSRKTKLAAASFSPSKSHIKMSFEVHLNQKHFWEFWETWFCPAKVKCFKTFQNKL